MKAILAKKIGVAQIFDEKGSALAVTALEVNPCEVTAIRQSPKETYNAIGFNMIDYLSLVQSGEPLRICYQLNLNEYRGNKTLQLMLKDIQPMEIN